MHKILLSLVAFAAINAIKAQDLSGQWKGSFIDNSNKYTGWGGNKCDYVIDLESNGKIVSGFSYTYFTEGGKRFYTICKLEGIADSKKKYVEFTEVERTKTNVPKEINNCFQIHKLTFFKKTDGDETLEGNWSPSPNQQGNCGFGTTLLSRRSLKSSFPNFKNPTSKSSNKFLNPVIASSKNQPSSPENSKVPINIDADGDENGNSVPNSDLSPKKESPLTKLNTESAKPASPGSKTFPSPGLQFEKRDNTVLKTIEVETSDIKIDMYDNGEVDGDSVSLFLNGKLVIARKKLTTQAITLHIPMDDLEEENELVMYAENLGTIPPNTALMVITDGSKRYEVRITSDLQKSGTIKFVKKNKIKPLE
jgi:hypothetical protein